MSSTVIIPSGPYLYDDPRFIYNEPCMFYDGGFDEQCLIDLGRVILPQKIIKGRSSGGLILKPQKRPTEDCKTILDFKIVACLDKVNGDELDCEETTRKYHLEYEPIEVTVNELKHRIDNYEISATPILASVITPTVCNIDKIKLLPIKTIVSSSLESRIRKSKILFKTELINKRKKK